jgi:ABC-2 type transport system permease protein
MSLQRLWSVMRKEIAQILRDRRTLGSMISLPVIQLVLYGYLSNEVLHQPTVVWDQSNSAESRLLIRTFENTRYFRVRPAARGMADIERGLDSGRAKVGIVIPPDYATQIRAGKPTQVLVVVDATDATSANTLLSVAGGIGATISQNLVVEVLQRAGQRAPPVPVEIRSRAWYNPDLKSQVFIVPGILAVVMQFATTFLSIVVIVREREMGTLEQLVVTPIQPIELILGKIIPLVGLAYINLTVILLLAWAWFGVAVKGNLLLLYAVTLAFFFSALGIGTLISTVARTFQQAMQLAQLALLPSILISGFLFPRESLPVVLQWVGLALPLTYFVIVVRGIMIKGVGIAFLWPQIIPLVVLGLLVFGIAIRRFQKKID